MSTMPIKSPFFQTWHKILTPLFLLVPIRWIISPVLWFETEMKPLEFSPEAAWTCKLIARELCFCSLMSRLLSLVAMLMNWTSIWQDWSLVKSTEPLSITLCNFEMLQEEHRLPNNLSVIIAFLKVQWLMRSVCILTWDSIINIKTSEAFLLIHQVGFKLKSSTERFFCTEFCKTPISN